MELESTKNKKFYQLSINQRQELIKQQLSIIDDLVIDDKLSNMVENYLTNFNLPLALANNLILDGKKYYIPLITEEASVVAALSNGFKLIGDNFQLEKYQKYIVGQIITQESYATIKNIIDQEYDYLREFIDNYKLSIKKRGGGFKSLELAYHDQDFTTIHIIYDSCEAMGANIINSILEAVSDYLKEKYQIKILMAILSNYHEFESQMSCCIKIGVNIDLATAQKIELASVYASRDVYRSSTHNKGVMNGMEAFLIAIGNDYRATNSQIYSYLQDHHLKTITTWKIIDDDLVGTIKIPLNLASVGGSILNNPSVQLVMKILDYPSSMQLTKLVLAIGLAQNLSALKALVTKGIQTGHMKLHARVIASKYSNQEQIIEYLVDSMIKNNNYSDSYCQELLKKKNTEN